MCIHCISGDLKEQVGKNKHESKKVNGDWRVLERGMKQEKKFWNCRSMQKHKMLHTYIFQKEMSKL